jgi:hypothetical protein
MAHNTKSADYKAGYKQGYNDRKDEQLAAKRGKESGKKISLKGRRDIAKGTRKPKGSYGFKKKKGK